jgi:uncharacterized protein (TIGR03435 family)
VRPMIRTNVSSLVLLFACNGVYCQSIPKLEFEVASIKPSPPPAGRDGVIVGCYGGPGTNDPSLFVCQNINLSYIVTVAYGIANWQFSAPDWMSSTRFDLRATVQEGATKEGLRVMLQNLLADRFKLSVHHESREIQRYELKVAKGGPKFKEAAPSEAKAPDSAPASAFPPKFDTNGCPVVDPRGGGIFTPTKARWYWPDTMMERLTSMLLAQVRGPVADLTGLDGKYTIDLCWTPENRVRPSAPGSYPAALPSEPSGPTLQQALQDQLGLRLESKKGPIDFLVVDHAEKSPTEN